MKKITPYILGLTLAIIIIYSMTDKVEVVGESMSPLIQPGQTVWGIKADTYKKNNVVIAYLDLGNTSLKSVKRVYGVEGDAISINEKVVKVNGEVVKILENNSKNSEFVLETDEYFLLGDNPNTTWAKVDGSRIQSRMELVR